MNLLIHYNRRYVLMVADAILSALALLIAYELRFEFVVPISEWEGFGVLLPVLLVVRIGCLMFLQVYTRFYRYASITDVLSILKAIVLSSFASFVVLLGMHRSIGFPRSVFLIEPLVAFVGISGLRVMLRLYNEWRVSSSQRKVSGSRTQKAVLIIGAGNAGVMVLRELRMNPRLGRRVVGFVDDDPRKQRMNIQGIKVLGSRYDIPRIVSSRGVEEIIIAIPSVSGTVIREIVAECHKTKALVRIVPELGALIDGRVTVNRIREVDIEDLLGREKVELDTAAIRTYVAGKRVLVTGAGGSIGSELCRQLMRFGVAELILFGRGEHSIYLIDRELRTLANSMKDAPVLRHMLGDVINFSKLDRIFATYRPQVVFHAAADKHVPLMEANPDEAVMNNVVGTQNVLKACARHRVEKVVCISTDKAADPCSIMGATKRLTEMLVQRHSEYCPAIAVRFGNVLGSRGSVIPLFREQIRNGGPVTVTHPEMLRYFMTISEAAQLVLQAGAIGKGGEVFLLDMGNPVKIVDLARQMLKLSGLEPDRDIEIRFTGLRPGEKLEETLTGKNETLARTDHPKIFQIIFEGNVRFPSDTDLQELRDRAIRMDRPGIIVLLSQLVPNYRPTSWT